MLLCLTPAIDVWPLSPSFFLVLDRLDGFDTLEVLEAVLIELRGHFLVFVVAAGFEWFDGFLPQNSLPQTICFSDTCSGPLVRVDISGAESGWEGARLGSVAVRIRFC